MRIILAVLILSFSFIDASLADDAISISASNLFKEYRSDVHAANHKYLGHEITVTGYVDQAYMLNYGNKMYHTAGIVLTGKNVNVMRTHPDVMLLFFPYSGARTEELTITDQQIIAMKKGKLITATCIINEPADDYRSVVPDIGISLTLINCHLQLTNY